MRAVLQSAYGAPDVLVVGETDRPVVRHDDVLLRVIAVSVHKGDWHLLTGTPYVMRLAGFGLLAPKAPIPGMAVSGRVEEVGRDVKTLRPGDEVFGEIRSGGFAEFVCVREGEVAIKPPGVSFEDAAALPISATTALQGLRDAGRLQPGQSVLINGAAGGVGTFAVQIAKALGAEVTGVCSSRNVDLLRSIGADHVIDYSADDFTAGSRRYDVIFDLVGNRSRGACRRVLTERGRLVASAGGADRRWLGPMIPLMAGLVSNLFSRQPFVPLMAMPDRADLITVAGFVEAGQVRPVIGRRWALDEIPEALRQVGLGHSAGKHVVTV